MPTGTHRRAHCSPLSSRPDLALRRARASPQRPPAAQPHRLELSHDDLDAPPSFDTSWPRLVRFSQSMIHRCRYFSTSQPFSRTFFSFYLDTSVLVSRLTALLLHPPAELHAVQPRCCATPLSASLAAVGGPSKAQLTHIDPWPFCLSSPRGHSSAVVQDTQQNAHLPGRHRSHPAVLRRAAAVPTLAHPACTARPTTPLRREPAGRTMRRPDTR